MAKERLSMRNIKEAHDSALNINNPADKSSCTIARSIVQEYLYRAGPAEVTWPLSPEMHEAHNHLQISPFQIIS
jgi:hypothetical protein